MSIDASDSGQDPHRPEIAMAWRRAELNGLDPGMGVRETTMADVEKRSSLSTAAGPILDALVADLADTRFSVLLADRTSRIIDRRVDDPTVARALDRVLAIPGFQYLEEISGTNSLATAFELRRPVSVTGDEHFLEALRYFCCYGAPIIHPVTHRLEGVLDVSGPVADATALLGPFLLRAAKDIEERLLEGARVAEKQLLAEFQARGNQRHAVLALGEGLALANTTAIDQIKGDDHVALRDIAADLSNHHVHECSIVLSSGSEVTVRARLVPGTRGGALFEIVDRTVPAAGQSASGRPPRRRSDRPEPTSDAASIVAVTGEPGTGRTTAAVALAGAGCSVHAAAGAVADEDSWLVALCAAIEAGRPTVVDDIDALSDRLARLLASPVREARGKVVLTSAPSGELAGPHRALASLALSRHDLQPLRSYPHEIVTAAKLLLGEILPTSTVEVAPSALQILCTQDWPGNLRELRDVLTFAARGRDCGVITDRDLPESIRTSGAPPRALSRLESLERDAIIASLREAGGNRAKAAAALGIGRTTLYDRLRRYRISATA